MKLSDYVAAFLAGLEIRHVFAITGGAAVHLIDSIAKHPAIDYICPQHEQAGAMAADAYARTTGKLGAAISTSGPGATNMITGICCAYYDSVPVLYISGQVSTFRLKGESGVRQIGFQETEIVAMCRPITKYAVLLEDPQQIRYELEKACYLAQTGRPGPVLIDIPDNLQREEVDPAALCGFSPREEAEPAEFEVPAETLQQCRDLLSAAQRPVLILGWGVRLAGAEQQALRLVEALQIPVLLTWGVIDLLPAEHPLQAGTFGTHGSRYGNFTVQNADLILSVGCRLDTHVTGSPLSSFAREAEKIVVDIDPAELDKFSRYGMPLRLGIKADAKGFLEQLLPVVEVERPLCVVDDWKVQVQNWKKTYPVCDNRSYCGEGVNPYLLVKSLAAVAPSQEHFFIDTGCGVAWMMQGFPVKGEQRLFHAFNNTPMGYALPASIGSSFALDSGQVTCVSGDGGLQMNIQELATVLRHQLPIKIFLLNNGGYNMIQQTQEQWLDARYEASTVKGGLAFPDFVKVARAYGFKTFSITGNNDVASVVEQVYAEPGPVFCDVQISPAQRVVPQVKFGRPIEDPEPFLPRDEFFRNMLIPVMDVCNED